MINLEWQKNEDTDAEYNSHIAIDDEDDEVSLEVFSDRDGNDWGFFVENGEDETSEHGFGSKKEAMAAAEEAARDLRDVI